MQKNRVVPGKESYFEVVAYNGGDKNRWHSKRFDNLKDAVAYANAENDAAKAAWDLDSGVS